jgi:hydroxyethylthiazole kinase
MHELDALSRDDLSSSDLPHIAAMLLDRLRTRNPKAHCITNAVAQNFTANALLAAGCVPSMTLSPEEIAQFVARSDALLINLGTFDRERREATEIAVETASQNNVPWVLDPVFVDRAPPRVAFARKLVALAPKAVRLNQAEFSALADCRPVRAELIAYALDQNITIGLSGETDLVTDGKRVASIANGHLLMAKVTAMGCAASALIAAFLAIEPDAWRATVAALVMIGVAGELASENAQGPGTFAVAIIDALHNLDGPTLIARARTEFARVN